MKIVEAEKQDARLIGEVVATAVGDEIVENFAFPKTKADVLRLFSNLAAREDSQYSYRNTLKAIDDDGTPMGFIIGYDGAELHRLRKAFFEECRSVLERELEGLVADECQTDEYYLDSLTVFPEYRGKGVARTLINAMTRRAVSHHKPIGLLCDKTNTKARRLYDSLGFLPVGETPFAGETMDHLQIPL